MKPHSPFSLRTLAFKETVRGRSMKKYSIIAALITALYVSISSCSASARVGTKEHEAGAETHVN